MEQLRNPSARPTIVVDPANFGVFGPVDASTVGLPGPFGRERCLYALPLDPGPSLLAPPCVVHDSDSAYLADPTGALIGVGAVWVSRMAVCPPVEDTRRF